MVATISTSISESILLALAVVILVGRFLVRQIHLPATIGLVIGGAIIGPDALGSRGVNSTASATSGCYTSCSSLVSSSISTGSRGIATPHSRSAVADRATTDGGHARLHRPPVGPVVATPSIARE